MRVRLIGMMLCGLMGGVGCSGEAPAPAAPTEAPAAAAPAAPAPAPSEAEISVADIDRWSRGMAAESQAVQDAAAKLAAAKDDNARLEALTAATEMNTLDAGAAAAGVDADRYRRIRNILSGAVSQMSPIEMEMDVANMPPQMIEQMKQARAESVAQLQTELPADVFGALGSRAAELREQEKRLVGERLKVASAAR